MTACVPFSEILKISRKQVDSLEELKTETPRQNSLITEAAAGCVQGLKMCFAIATQVAVYHAPNEAETVWTSMKDLCDKALLALSSLDQMFAPGNLETSYYDKVLDLRAVCIERLCEAKEEAECLTNPHLAHLFQKLS